MVIIKKKIIALFILCLHIMSMAACRSQQLDEERTNETQVKTGKEVIVIGAISFEWRDTIRNEITRFNRNSETHRIEIKQYGEGYWNDEEGIMKLNTELITGKGPDIIIMPPSLPMDIYVQKNILSELYYFIDADETFKRSDFFENILRAYEINDQLFGIPVTFNLETVLGPKSEFDDISNWTLDEMMKYVNGKMPESLVYADAGKSAVLDFCLTGNEELLVDWENINDSFKHEIISKILRFANQFTTDGLVDYGSYPDYERISDGDVQLMPYRVSSFSDNQLPQAVFHEPITYIGFPIENGNGNLIVSSELIAINQYSQYKTEAWEFIKMLLTEQYQSKRFNHGLPIIKSAFELLAIEMMADKGIYAQSWGDVWIKLVPPTENEIQIVRNLIENADKIQKPDQQIHNIVMEEGQSFFNGIKTTEEVINVIENRIRVYTNEIGINP